MSGLQEVLGLGPADTFADFTKFVSFSLPMRTKIIDACHWLAYYRFRRTANDHQKIFVRSWKVRLTKQL
jgi:hypothetical protein